MTEEELAWTDFGNSDMSRFSKNWVSWLEYEAIRFMGTGIFTALRKKS